MFSLQKRCLAGSLHNRYFNYKEKIINIRFTGTKNPAPLFIKIPVCHHPLRTTKNSRKYSGCFSVPLGSMPG